MTEPAEQGNAGLLTPEQLEHLPEHLREHYRRHAWVRHPEDIEHFPEPVRSTLQRLTVESRPRSLRRMADVDAARARAS